MQETKFFKAFIRVVKSINQDSFYNTFASRNIVEERLIEANDKEEVKQLLLGKYPQFFPNAKVYSKETKDQAQFFYVLIYELNEWEKQQLTQDTSWACAHCGQQYANTYLHRPSKCPKLFGDLKFCRETEEHSCLDEYKKEFYKHEYMPDDVSYITSTSVNYIYKITEKSTSKCYIGKTRNAPFFRWWNHLTHSSSPFGIYLRTTLLSDWTFEVLEILPYNTPDAEVFRIESNYINHFDSIKNGYNSLISNKSEVLADVRQLSLLDLEQITNKN